jgi:hypothetical protein
MKRASLFLQSFTQPVEISLVLFFAKETGFSIVSPLNDVQGYAIKVNTGTTGHMQTIVENIRAWPL